jgi:asparagine synthase (glutamine-hydrolysing)
MCGIAGIVYLNGQDPSIDTLTSMASLLSHRGPNGLGISVQSPIGLAHSRLSILDLTERGKQPMSYGGGRYWITFNGEIYNFLEIREQLKQQNYQFCSDTDTEVILASFLKWGVDAVNKFLGMFAFAIWDNEEKILHLFRDRFGVKPLYYYYDGKILAFVSEIKGLLAIPEIDLNYNEQNLAAISASPKQTEGLEITPFHNVNKVLPGFRITFTPHNNKLVKHRWWRLIEELPEVSTMQKKQAEKINELLYDACRLSMRSDVPLGICLSGGLDSSSVFGVSTKIHESEHHEPRISSEKLTTFIMRTREKDNEEQILAEAFSQNTGAKTKLLDNFQFDPQLTNSNLQKEYDLLCRMTYDFEGIGFIFPAQWKLYQGVKKSGIHVTLDGHGADECFGGYHQYSEMNILDTCEDFVNSTHTLNNMFGNTNAWSKFAKFHGIPNIEGSFSYNYTPEFVSKGGASLFFQTQTKFMTPDNWAKDEKEMVGSDNLFRLMYYNATSGYLQWILRAYDHASMSHGVESRVPFLDHRLFSYALALPAKSKIKAGLGKYILRVAMNGLVPNNILNRGRKIGLNYPINKWLSGPLLNEILSMIRSSEFINGYPWDGQKVLDYINSSDTNINFTMEPIFPLIQAHILKKEFQKTRVSILNSH